MCLVVIVPAVLYRTKKLVGVSGDLYTAKEASRWQVFGRSVQPKLPAVGNSSISYLPILDNAFESIEHTGVMSWSEWLVSQMEQTSLIPNSCKSEVLTRVFELEVREDRTSSVLTMQQKRRLLKRKPKDSSHSFSIGHLPLPTNFSLSASSDL